MMVFGGRGRGTKSLVMGSNPCFGVEPDSFLFRFRSETLTKKSA